jgi:hypothetical protein
MRRISLCVGALFLALAAESCLVSTKSVEVPIRDEATMSFIALGVAGADPQLIDFCQELSDAESGDIDHVDHVSVENIYWRLVENRGDPDTQVTANVTLQRVGGQSAVLVPDTTFVLSDADTVFKPAHLDSAGLTLLLQGMNEYADYYNGGKVGPCPSLDYTFTWSMTATPYADFTWEAKVKFTVVATARVDVPDLWD